MLAKKPKRVRLRKNTNLHKLIEDVAAGGVPLILERDGKDVAIVPEDDMADQDLEATWARLSKAFGAWEGLHEGDISKEIYEARHKGKRKPPVRL